MPKKLYILKVQISLNDPDALPLVYDQKRKHQKQQRIPPAILQDMNRARLVKAFYVGEWNDNLETWLFIAPIKRVTTLQDW